MDLGAAARRSSATGWTPERDFHLRLAGVQRGDDRVPAGARRAEHPVDAEAWRRVDAPLRDSWGTVYGFEHLAFTPLFGHQYSHTWVDFRGIQDEFMRSARHRLLRELAARDLRATCLRHRRIPHGWHGYGANSGAYGLGRPREHGAPLLGESAAASAAKRARLSRSDFFDDGTIAPTAAGGSIAFAPEIVFPAVQDHARRSTAT